MNRTLIDRELFYRIRKARLLGTAIIILMVRLKVLTGGGYVVIPA